MRRNPGAGGAWSLVNPIKGNAVLESVPAGRPVAYAVFFKFLTGDGVMAGYGSVDGLGGEVTAQFLVAEIRAILVRDLPGCKSLIGNRKGKLADFALGIDNAVVVIPAAGLKLESCVLDRHDEAMLDWFEGKAPPMKSREPRRSNYSFVTFSAWKPLGPLVTVNSTDSPSARDLNPLD